MSCFQLVRPIILSPKVFFFFSFSSQQVETQEIKIKNKWFLILITFPISIFVSTRYYIICVVLAQDKNPLDGPIHKTRGLVKTTSSGFT